MRYPKFLREKGTIGFVAPSFGCATEPYITGFGQAQKEFQKRGYALDLGPNCYAGCGIGISNTPEKCGRELTDYYVSRGNEVLISCGGGELMCEILDDVDFEQLRKAEPKWFMGYSDNTNMTFLLPTLCDTAAIYGPCATSFYGETWHPSLEDAFGILNGKKVQQGSREHSPQVTVKNYDGWELNSLKDEEHPLVPYNITEPFHMKKYVGKTETEETVTFEGRLLGGCADCLTTLLGTGYDKVAEFQDRYQQDGVVWFLECCDFNVMGIRRAMWQMEHAGWFENAKGFLIGRPVCYGQEMMGLDAYRAVTEVLGRHQVPILMDVDLGHLPPMMPMVAGSYGIVRAEGNQMSVEMKLQ